MAQAGFKVHGIEKEKFILDKLKKQSHFYEPNLDELLNKLIRKNLVFQKILKMLNLIFILLLLALLLERKQIIQNLLKILVKKYQKN